MKCENCSVSTNPNTYELHDYCAVCGKNLCKKCMAAGHCGNVPALSGNEADNADE